MTTNPPPDARNARIHVATANVAVMDILSGREQVTRSGRAFCTRRRLPASSTTQLRAWDAWQAERYQRGEISQRPGYTDNPFQPR